MLQVLKAWGLRGGSGVSRLPSRREFLWPWGFESNDGEL